MRRLVLRADGMTPDSVIGSGFCCATTGGDAAEIGAAELALGVTSAVADADARRSRPSFADRAPTVDHLVDALADLSIGTGPRRDRRDAPDRLERRAAAAGLHHPEKRLCRRARG